MVVTLTIAGSDPSGGAGIQADLKTFHAFGVYGTAVIAALTAQDTTAVRAVTSVDPGLVAAQLDAVLDDLAVRATKTGLLASVPVIVAVADRLRAHRGGPLVVDPVMVATSGDRLAEPAALETLRDLLLPLATLVTPNLAEAAALTGRPVTDLGGMRDAARALVDRGTRAALVTGGHLAGAPIDVLCADGLVHDFEGTRRPVGAVHGAGCTLSAAITAGLAEGRTLADSIVAAKRYVEAAIGSAAALGRGSRPLNHLARPT